MNDAADLVDILRRLLAEALALVGGDRGMVALVDADRVFIRGKVGLNLPDGLLEATVRRIYPGPHPDEDIYALVARTGEQQVFADDHPAVHRPTMERFAMWNEYRVLTPISSAGSVIGVLGLRWLGDNAPDFEDLAMLRLIAAQAGGAVARARLVETERALRECLVAALRVSRTMVYRFDDTGRLDVVEGDTERITGLPPQELIGQPIAMVLERYLAPMDRDAARAALTERLRGSEESRQFRLRMVDHLGRTVPVLVAAGPHKEGDRVVGGIGVVTDLSTTQQLVEERDAARQAQALAEGAIRTGRSVAHELGSPLGTILGLGELLAEDERLPPDIKADLLTLREQAERAGDLLSRFSHIARYREVPAPGGPQLDLDQASEDHASKR